MTRSGRPENQIGLFGKCKLIVRAIATGFKIRNAKRSESTSQDEDISDDEFDPGRLGMKFVSEHSDALKLDFEDHNSMPKEPEHPNSDAKDFGNKSIDNRNVGSNGSNTRGPFSNCKCDPNTLYAYNVRAGIEKFLGDRPCNCMQCTPEMYKLCPDGAIHAELMGPKLRHAEFSEDGHGAFELVQLIRSWFAEPFDSLSLEQKTAVQDWNNLLGSLKTTLNVEDTSVHGTKLVSRALQLLSQIFFRDHLRDFQVEWDHSLHDTHIVGQVDNYKIQLDPTIDLDMVPGKDRDRRWEEHLNTLVHEATHGMLCQYSCKGRKCHTLQNAKDHGRAWQILAKHVESFAKQHLGWDCDVGRVDEIFAVLDKYSQATATRSTKAKYLRVAPSAHDMQAVVHADEDGGQQIES
ncbi:MAG: hypothetical protein M1820_006015 [Bogoriella megaspora]|nr:MAG: hypothetical protein M1820_006015 [Bogoriella megaspora]